MKGLPIVTDAPTVESLAILRAMKIAFGDKGDEIPLREGLSALRAHLRKIAAELGDEDPNDDAELWKLEHARAEEAEERVARALRQLEAEMLCGRIATHAHEALKAILEGKA